MDALATSMEFLDDLASIMRNAILCAIGTVSATLLINLTEVDLKLISILIGKNVQLCTLISEIS